MYEEFNPYENYTIEDQAHDLQISIEECKAFNASGLSWSEWIASNYEVIESDGTRHPWHVAF